MRGRTNITQRAVPYVNGDTITAEVASGNVINTGDFVDYKHVENIREIEVGDREFICSIRNFKSQNKYNVVLSGRYGNMGTPLNILEVWENDILKDRVLDVKDICQLGDNLFLSTYEIENYVKFKFFNLVNGQINFLSEYNTLPRQSSLLTCGKYNSDKIIILSYNQNDRKKIYFDIYSYDSNYNVTLYKQIYKAIFDNSIDFVFNFAIYCRTYFLLEDDKFLLFLPINGINVSRYLIGTFIFEVDGNDITFTYETTEYSSYSNIMYIFPINNNTIVLCWRKGSSRSSSYAYYRIYRYENGVLSNNGTELVSNLFPSVYTTNLYLGFLNFVKENVFLFAIYDKTETYTSKTRIKVIRCELNPLNFTISVSNELILQEFSRNVVSRENGFMGLACSGNNEEYSINFTLDDSSKFYNFYQAKIKYLNNLLEFDVDKDYVEEYSGKGVLGFAKSSGIAGQTVSIYIPHQS